MTYEETLLAYFEEEIEGEAYFAGLAPHFDEPGAADKLLLLARVERHAAEVTRPLLARRGLTPRSDRALDASGRRHVDKQARQSWQDFVRRMAQDYPRYIPMFEALEAMAPEEDRRTLRILTEHEHATIRFARRELAGDPRSSDELRVYLSDSTA